jgi:hypothetical protein|tara:strand:+ start:1517 stop:1789 length:273 start_codon:yes stop_codon:yes gene_type:complete
MNQKEQLINYLNEHFSITTLECMQKLMILDLQGIIRDLKGEGHRIESFYISRKNMYGDVKKFKRYYLIQNPYDYVQFQREREVLKGIVLE